MASGRHGGDYGQGHGSGGGGGGGGGRRNNKKGGGRQGGWRQRGGQGQDQGQPFQIPTVPGPGTGAGRGQRPSSNNTSVSSNVNIPGNQVGQQQQQQEQQQQQQQQQQPAQAPFQQQRNAWSGGLPPGTFASQSPGPTPAVAGTNSTWAKIASTPSQGQRARQPSVAPAAVPSDPHRHQPGSFGRPPQRPNPDAASFTPRNQPPVTQDQSQVDQHGHQTTNMGVASGPHGQPFPQADGRQDDGGRGRGRYRVKQQGQQHDSGNASHSTGRSGAQNTNTATNLETNKQDALKAVDEHARTQASKDPKSPIDVSTEKSLKLYKLSEGLRADFADTSRGKRIITNHLTLQTPDRIFIYEIDMIRERYQNASGGISIARVGKASDKQKVMAVVLPQIQALAMPGGPAPTHWVTDNDLIWSTQDLFNVTIPGQVVHEQLQLVYHNECAVPLTVEEVTIRFRNVAPLPKNPSQYFQDPAAMADKRSDASILLRGLNAFLTAHGRTQTQSFMFTGGNKGFELNRWKLLDPRGTDGLRAMQGFFLSAHPGNDQMLVNISTATSAFFGNGLTVDDFLKSAAFSQVSIAKKAALLKGVKVEFTFPFPSGNGTWNPPENRHRFINDVGRFIDRQRCHGTPAVTVETCFMNYRPECNSRMMRPLLRDRILDTSAHAIKVTPHAKKDDDGYEWFPANMLRILPNQPFHHALTSKHTSEMIKVAREIPPDQRNRISREGFGMFGFDTNTQAGLQQRFGLTVGRSMISIPAVWLAPPRVHYGNSSHDGYSNEPPTKLQQVKDASWNLMFAHPKSTRASDGTPVLFAETNSKITALPFVNTTSMATTSAEFRDVLNTLRTALLQHGILAGNLNPQWTQNSEPRGAANRISNASANPSDGYEAKVVRALTRNKAGNDGTMPILIAIWEKSFDVYAYIKRVAELQLGLNTVFLTFRQAWKFQGQNASNIALKYNFKLAQNTHILDAQGFAAIRSSTSSTDTIVIGADVTHPGKGANEGCPSVAAVVGSVDAEFMRFPGSMRLQRSKKEYVTELGDMVKERLIDWAEKNGDRLPGRMLFYRDGVSESQYAKLRTYEMPQIKQAYNWAREFLEHKRNGGTHQTPLAPNNTTRQPWPQPANGPASARDDKVDDLYLDHNTHDEQFQLSYVVVGKRHHTRFYPTSNQDIIRPGGTGGNANAKPGLLVDQVITHPYSFDFYLQSHAPINGTGRSAHYFVLQNNMDLRTDELQTVTHELCYAYSRATKGVSYCAPAYYADRLCDRARAYLRPWLVGEDFANYKPFRAKNQGESALDYHDHIKNNLRDQPFWRHFVANNPADPRTMKYGFTRRNPWHPNLDDIMFYL